MIQVSELKKSFRIYKKAPGFLGSLRSLVIREWVTKEALKGINLQVGPGEILGLIGANGAGKTTLVKILSGIVHPSQGQAEILGYTPWHRSVEFRRNISLIMGQKAQLWWDLPAEDCFLLLREIYQIPHAQYRRDLEFLVETLGVQEQLNVQIRRLSLGERMKMELVAALLHRPRVVFLDEPTIGLDLTAQNAIRRFIRAYREEHQPAMILTSHYMDDIEQLCERVALMKEGEIFYDGPLKKITQNFTQHKILSIHTDPNEKLPLYSFPYGQLIESDEGNMRFEVARAQLPAAVSHVLNHLPVHDLSIEEEDVARVIESMIRRGMSTSEQQLNKEGTTAL